METLKKNLANLLKVKTIVTLLLTIVFCVLALIGEISSSDFLTVFTVVIAFYFGTQSEKKSAAAYTIPTEVAAVATEGEQHPPDEEEASLIGFDR